MGHCQVQLPLDYRVDLMVLPRKVVVVVVVLLLVVLLVLVLVLVYGVVEVEEGRLSKRNS